MKKIHYILIIALLFSFIGCNKSLKNNEYYSISGFNVESNINGDNWDGLIDPRYEYVTINFTDDYNAIMTIYKDGLNTVINRYNFQYVFNSDNGSGDLIMSDNNKISFAIYNNKPKRII